jgi:hypothetical protein
MRFWEHRIPEPNCFENAGSGSGSGPGYNDRGRNLGPALEYIRAT